MGSPGVPRVGSKALEQGSSRAGPRAAARDDQGDRGEQAGRNRTDKVAVGAVRQPKGQQYYRNDNKYQTRDNHGRNLHTVVPVAFSLV